MEWSEGLVIGEGRECFWNNIGKMESQMDGDLQGNHTESPSQSSFSLLNFSTQQSILSSGSKDSENWEDDTNDHLHQLQEYVSSMTKSKLHSADTIWLRKMYDQLSNQRLYSLEVAKTLLKHILESKPQWTRRTSSLPVHSRLVSIKELWESRTSTSVSLEALWEDNTERQYLLVQDPVDKFPVSQLIVVGTVSSSLKGLLSVKDGTGEMFCEIANAPLSFSKDNLVFFTSWNLVLPPLDQRCSVTPYMEAIKFEILLSAYSYPKTEVLAQAYSPKSIQELAQAAKRNEQSLEAPGEPQSKKRKQALTLKDIHIFGYVAGTTRNFVIYLASSYQPHSPSAEDTKKMRKRRNKHIFFLCTICDICRFFIDCFSNCI